MQNQKPKNLKNPRKAMIRILNNKPFKKFKIKIMLILISKIKHNDNQIPKSLLSNKIRMKKRLNNTHKIKKT